MKKIVASLWLLAALFFSCSKHHDSLPGKCRIVGVIDSTYGANGAFFANTARLSYDNDGRLSLYAIISPTDTFSRVFTYARGYILIYPGSAYDSYDTVMLADSNRVKRVITYSRGYDQRDYFDFTYNPAGELQSESYYTSDPNYPHYTTTYTWSNGDIVSSKDSYGSVMTYTYYPDKLSTDGDPAGFRDFISYSLPVHGSKHLVKATNAPGGAVNYSYELDRQGKILSYTVSSGAYFRKSTYLYDCSH